MSQTVTAVLKKQQVKPNGVRPIGLAAPDGAAAQASAASGAAVAQVRIACQHADHAILEVQCPCGHVTQVECRWASPAPANGPGGPARPGQVPNPPKRKETT